MLKLLWLSLLIFLITGYTVCQNQFSQFYASPLLFNPANTGRFNKNYRIGGAFRIEKNIQAQAFTQNSFFLDSKILNSLAANNDCFAIGVLGLREQSINEGIKNTSLAISIAYQKALDEEGTQQLGIGFQTNYAHKLLYKPNLVFEDQINSWINAGYSNIDIFQLKDVDISYIDLNAGLIFQGLIGSKNFISTGISMYHITKPSLVFQGGEFNLSRQLWSHLAWETSLQDNRKMYAAVLVSLSDHSVDNIIAGLAYQFGLNKYAHINLGGWAKKNIARGVSFVPTIGIGYNAFTLNISNDISISKNANQRMASEISMVYTRATSKEKFNENKFIRF